MLIKIINICFEIKSIIISGNLRHVTEMQLRYVMDHSLHGTLITANIIELREILHEIPWVSGVTINRQFPDTLLINIKEHIAIARISHDYLISNTGEVFSAAHSAMLPEFFVQHDLLPIAYNNYIKIQKVLQKHNDSVLKLYNRSPFLFVIETNNSIRISFCTADITQSLSILDNEWEQLHNINPNLHKINFCYVHGIAINTNE